MINKIFKYILYFFFLPIWWMQNIIPRNKNIWIFGAWYGEKYSDNAKYLFEHILSNNKKIRCIWLTRKEHIKKKLNSEGKECYLINSFNGAFYSLIGNKIIFSSGKSDVNSFFINGAKSIQLWHGAPMKKIGLDDRFSFDSFTNFIHKYFFPFVYEYNINYVVSTAEVFNKKLCSAFNIKDNQILLTGYPRNDVFYNCEKHQLIKEWDNNYGNPYKIIYLPTFRSHDENFQPFNNYNFDQFQWNKFLEQTNSLFILKGHFVNKIVGEKISGDRFIHLSDLEINDVNEILKDVDLLITDYSGAYFDFLLTEKPIILASFDIHEYLSKYRELYFNYNEILCGHEAKDWNEVIMEIQKIKLKDQFIEKRKYLSNMFNKYSDGLNSERLYIAILNS